MDRGVVTVKIYVVSCGEYDERTIMGICFTEEEAMQVCARENSGRGSLYEPWWYVEADVFGVSKENFAEVKQLWVAECRVWGGKWNLSVYEEENGTMIEGSDWMELNSDGKSAWGHITADSREEAEAKARRLLEEELEKRKEELQKDAGTN